MRKPTTKYLRQAAGALSPIIAAAHASNRVFAFRDILLKYGLEASSWEDKVPEATCQPGNRMEPSRNHHEQTE